MHHYCTDVLTEQGAGVSEGSDLRVGQAGEQSQQGGEQVLVKNKAVPTGAHQNPSKLTQAGFETPHLRAWSTQRVVH